jgi:hypothetical protein
MPMPLKTVWNRFSRFEKIGIIGASGIAALSLVADLNGKSFSESVQGLAESKCVFVCG